MTGTNPPTPDPTIHHPTRLTLTAFLAGCAEAEFAAVRDYCEISDASVSRIVTALEQAGYVHVRKGYLGRRPRPWLSLTSQGRAALDRHLAALQALVATTHRAGTRTGRPEPDPAAHHQRRARTVALRRTRRATKNQKN
ncbi:transcriptional regulator [Kitasatospora purpeofusca]|uniref:transcriptional regulator n=1 Tax=Kitasatospora purpeofusca TaxID=67352 RepID=UPI0035D9AF90